MEFDAFKLIQNNTNYSNNEFKHIIKSENFNINAKNKENRGFLEEAFKADNIKLFIDILNHKKLDIIAQSFHNFLLVNLLLINKFNFAIEIVKHKLFDINYYNAHILPILIIITDKGNLKALQFVLNCKNLNINIIHPSLKQNALVISIKSNDEVDLYEHKKVKLLLSYPNIDINYTSDVYDPILISAAKSPHTFDILKILIGFTDIDLKCKRADGLNILETVLLYNNCKAYEYIRKHRGIPVLLSKQFYDIISREDSSYPFHRDILRLYNMDFSDRI